MHHSLLYMLLIVLVSVVILGHFVSQVIGNMAAAMGAASPALKSAVIQCVNEPAATPEVQLAAIQAYRQTTLPEEVTQNFLDLSYIDSIHSEDL